MNTTTSEVNSQKQTKSIKYAPVYLRYTMSKITTVKLSVRTKMALNGLKSERETYDQVISKLTVQAKEKTLKSDLVEAYKSLGKKELKILEEWEAASANFEE